MHQVNWTNTWGDVRSCLSKRYYGQVASIIVQEFILKDEEFLAFRAGFLEQEPLRDKLNCFARNPMLNWSMRSMLADRALPLGCGQAVAREVSSWPLVKDTQFAALVAYIELSLGAREFAAFSLLLRAKIWESFWKVLDEWNCVIFDSNMQDCETGFRDVDIVNQYSFGVGVLKDAVLGGFCCDDFSGVFEGLSESNGELFFRLKELHSKMEAEWLGRRMFVDKSSCDLHVNEVEFLRCVGVAEQDMLGVFVCVDESQNYHIVDAEGFVYNSGPSCYRQYVSDRIYFLFEDAFAEVYPL